MRCDKCTTHGLNDLSVRTTRLTFFPGVIWLIIRVPYLHVITRGHVSEIFGSHVGGDIESDGTAASFSRRDLSDGPFPFLGSKTLEVGHGLYVKPTIRTFGSALSPMCQLTH